MTVSIVLKLTNSYVTFQNRTLEIELPYCFVVAAKSKAVLLAELSLFD